MTTRNLIASALLAGTLIAAPTLLLAAGPNGSGGGGQAAQRGTTQQTATRTRDRLHAPAAATPASMSIGPSGCSGPAPASGLA